LPEVKEFAKRVGDTLIFKLDNGKSISFINTKEPDFTDDENGQKSILTFENSDTGKLDTSFTSVKYILNGNAFNGRYLILNKIESVDTYEDGRAFRTTLLVNKKSGAQIKLVMVSFSPNKNRFATMQNMASPEVEISNINNDDKMIVEFVLKPTVWEPQEVIWLSDIEFKIIRSNLDTGKLMLPLIYKFNGTKWVLATAIPAKKPATTVKKPIKK